MTLFLHLGVAGFNATLRRMTLVGTAASIASNNIHTELAPSISLWKMKRTRRWRAAASTSLPPHRRYPDCSGALMKAHPHPPHIMNVFQHPHTEPRGCVCSCIHNSSSSAYTQTINTAANVEVSSHNGCPSVALMWRASCCSASHLIM